MTSITISIEQFKNLPETTQTEILSLFQKQKQITLDTETIEGELTRKQVSQLINGLSDKTRLVLKTAIKEFESDQIHYDQLLEKLDMVGENLTGVWAGVTKRSRTVTHDSKFKLIDWIWNEEGSVYIGKIHPRTHSLLAEYFK